MPTRGRRSWHHVATPRRDPRRCAGTSSVERSAIDERPSSRTRQRRLPMTTARDLMTADPAVLPEDVTAADAARQMADRNIGALPVCNAEGRLAGVITDRDLAVRIVAEGRDPSSTRVGDLLEGGEVVTIGADDSAEEAIRTMKDHAVRRLP